MDWTYFLNTLQPLTLFYAVLPPEPAYALAQGIVFATAFFGMRSLITTSLGNNGTLIIPAIFAFGLSYPAYGIGLAAAPWIIWFTVRHERFGVTAIIATSFIGFNSNLVLHSIWQPVGSLIAISLLGQSCHLKRFIAVHSVLWIGAVASASGLIWRTLVGPITHRSDWPARSLQSFETLLGRFFEDLLSLSHQYHAVKDPAYFAVIVLLIAVQLGFFRLTIMYLVLLACTAVLWWLKPLFEQLLWGPLATLQYDRIGFFAPLAALILAAVLLNHRPNGLKGIISLGFVRLSLTITLIIFMAQTAGLLLPSHKAPTTVSGYYRVTEYRCLASEIRNGRVLSVGIDPMIAPANGVAALDGYHAIYPLEYKRSRPSMWCNLSGGLRS